MRQLCTVLRIVRQIICQSLFVNIVRCSLRDGQSEQRADAVADEAAIILHWQLRQTGPAQRPVGACADVRQRVQKRSVQIENDGSDLPAVLHQTPILLRRMISASSGVVVEV